MDQAKREKEMQKVLSRIKTDALKLKKLGYVFSDHYSTICLFDNQMYSDAFMNLTEDQQDQVIIDSLY